MAIDTLPPVPTDEWDSYTSQRFQRTTDEQISNITADIAPPKQGYDQPGYFAPGGNFDPSHPQTFATGGQGTFQEPDAPAPQPEPAPSESRPSAISGQADFLSRSDAQIGALTEPYVTADISSPPASQVALPASPSPGRQLPPDLVAQALNAADEAGVDTGLFLALVNQESNFNPNAKSPVGALGLTQLMPDTARSVGVTDPFDPGQSLRGGARYLKQQLDTFGGDVVKALAAYNAGPGAVQKYGIEGVLADDFAKGETKRYVTTIMDRRAQEQSGNPAGGAAPGPTEGISRAGAALATANASRDISQFGDPQLTTEEAYAACGPAAAVRFAQAFGRNPTLKEALDVAKQVGWTAAQGMAGLSSEKALMDKLGVPTKLISGPAWDQFAREAATGNPVTISTAGHYFTADGYDQNTGKYHVGRSGLDLKGGKEWMTPAEMTALMGEVQGGLLADNPQVPAPSTADQDSPNWWDRTKDAIGSTIGNIFGGSGAGTGAVVAAQPDLTQAVSPVPVPGSGFDPSHMQPVFQTDQGVPVRRDVRDLNQPAQPTVFDAAGQAIGGAIGDVATGTGQEVLARGAEETRTAGQFNAARQQFAPSSFEPGGMLSDEVMGRATAAFERRLRGQPAQPGDEEAIAHAGLAVGGTVSPINPEAGGGLGRIIPERNPPSTPVGATATKVEQVLDSGLVIPGRTETPTGPAQILGPRGEVLSTVASREVQPGVGVVRSKAGAEQITAPSGATIVRMPNIAKMAPDMPEVQATIQRMAEENPQLIDAFRQGTITHQELINDLAPRLGITADDFLKSKVGQAFNPEELLALRAAVVQKQAQAVQLADDIASKGGVGALSAAEKVDAINQIVDAARLTAVGRGGAATAGRTLNQQKIVITQEMAQAITGGNEAKAAQVAKAAADARATRAQAAIERTQQLQAERKQAVAAAQQITDEARRKSVLTEISKAYDELNRYQGMTLAEKDEVFQTQAAARAKAAAERQAALQKSDPAQELLNALRAELKAEQQHFAGSRETWQDMAFYASKRGEILKQRSGDGQIAWLEAQRKAAQQEARIAEQRAGRAFDTELRVRERQQQQAERVLEALGGRKVTEDMLRHFVELQRSGDPLAVAKFLRGMAKTSMWDRIGILRYASMLSSTATHLTNSMGNTIQLGLDVGLKPLVVGADIVVQGLRGGERTRYMGEIPQQIRGMMDGALAGTKDAWTVLKSGIDPRLASKLDQTRAGFNSGNAVVDLVAEAPLRLLAAADNIFRGAARGGQVRALATRQAIREGYQGAARSTRVEEIVQNITEFPALLDEAEKGAARVVLQESRQEIAGLARQPAGPAGLIRSVFLPFVKTPYNIAAQGLGMTPAGVLAAAKAGANGQRGEAVDRVARALFGSAIMGVAGAAGMGGFLTGAYPKDESARSTLPPGWKPWSVRLPTADGGAMYVSYQNLGPVGVPIAIAAVMTEAARQGQPIDPAKVVAGFGRYMVDQTFLQGVNAVVQAIEEPDRYAENLSEGLATPSIPYSALQRQIERAIGMADRDPHGAVDALLAASPLTAEQVQPRTTPLGEPIRQGQSGAAAFVSPFRYDIEHDTPVLQALRTADVGVPAMPKKLSVRGQEIALTQTEQAQLKAARGQRIQEFLGDEIQAPEYQRLDAFGRQKRLRTLVERATSQADKEFLNAMSDEQYFQRLKEPQPVPYVVGAR